MVLSATDDRAYALTCDDRRGQIASRAVVMATGITANRDREVFRVEIGDSAARGLR